MSLIESLILSEGYKKDPYLDTKNHYTGGYGHLMTPSDWLSFNATWTDKEKKEYWLKQLVTDISIATKDINWLTFEWKYQPSEPQVDVLIELAFNLGLTRLLGFKKFLRYFQQGKIKEAASELIDSKWHRDFVLWNSGKDTPNIRSRRLEKKLLDSI